MQNFTKVDFFSVMNEHQISASEFFGVTLIDIIHENFGFENAVISYFDTDGKFLSWVDAKGTFLDCDAHPYREFMPSDLVRFTVFKDAVFDKLTYFNTIPRVYKSTDIIGKKDYESSSYVKSLEKTFGAYYSATLVFGTNGYIQVAFFRKKEDGDFEQEELKEIYTYIANSYKNFKKHEQSKIISKIKTEIIELGEKAYIIADDFNNIMNANCLGCKCLRDILGLDDDFDMSDNTLCEGIKYLIDSAKVEDGIKTRVFKNFVLKIYLYNQSYSNGIIDKYYWITIVSKKSEISHSKFEKNYLTQAEQKIAELMYDGLTYREIACQLIISYHTVKKHVQNIYIKCDVNSRHQLCRWIEKNNQGF